MENIEQMNKECRTDEVMQNQSEASPFDMLNSVMSQFEKISRRGRRERSDYYLIINSAYSAISARKFKMMHYPEFLVHLFDILNRIFAPPYGKTNG